MNETQAIIRAFDEAHGQNCAMATVVSVEGSAYRCPGARMPPGRLQDPAVLDVEITVDEGDR
jgi:hypothetical protein